MDGSSSFFTWFGNTISMGAIVSAFTGWAPPVAAFVAFIWYMIQIYESETMKKLIQRRLRRKLIKLHQQATELELQLTDPADVEAIGKVKDLSARRTEMDTSLRRTALDKKND